MLKRFPSLPPAAGRARRRASSGAAAAGLALLMAAMPGGAFAADLTVRVLNKSTGQPLEGASACLGTDADPVQLGARHTGPDGKAAFADVPGAPLSLIVSKSGYRSERKAVSGGPYDQELTILLAKGSGGRYSCDAGAVVTRKAGPAPPFLLDRGAAVTADRRVSLHFSAERATEYRASESSDFAGAEWRTIEGTPAFELSAGPGRKTVYLQLRRYREAEGARLETRSEVLSDSIVLR